MFPIHDYHRHSYSAGAQADVHCLYYAVCNENPDVSLAELLIEKGEFVRLYYIWLLVMVIISNVLTVEGVHVHMNISSGQWVGKGESSCAPPPQPSTNISIVSPLIYFNTFSTVQAVWGGFMCTPLLYPPLYPCVVFCRCISGEAL